MSWWTDLRDYGREMLVDLEHAAAVVTRQFDEHVAPVIADTARQLDAGIEQAFAGSFDDLEADLVRKAGDLDQRYQQFMVRRVDPMFGQTRTDQLAEMGGLHISPHEQMLNRRIAFAGATLVAILAGRAFFPASLVISVPVSFAVAWPIYGMAYQSVRKQKRVTYHLVSAISLTAIWLSGLYVPAIAASVLYYMSEKLLLITEDRSQKGLISVFSTQDRSVVVLRSGIEREVALDTIEPGDIVVVQAGGFMPVDGTVVAGLASIDQQMLTGEAQPAEKSPGDPVFASTIVLGGKIQVRVDRAGSETVAAKIGDILNTTASYQFALQSKGSKLAHDGALPTLLLSALALTTLGPAGALAILNSAFGASFRLSAPIAMLNLLNIASANAILLKDGRSLELLSDIDTVVFDKTGTLTLSTPNVAGLHCIGADERALLGFAAAAEHRQTHPIALAILAEARARGIAVADIDNARYEVGYGIKVELAGRRIQVGSDRFMASQQIALPPAIAQAQAECHDRGHSLVMVAVDGILVGAIELQPTLRPEVDQVIEALRARGLQLVILSGDQAGPTGRLAARLGMDRHFSDVLPEGKASLIAQLQAEGHAVCFVGDGINDSIALKTANVSVSLRGATTVATDAAQVVLMQESLRQLPFLFELGDDMERSLKHGHTASMVPGMITVGGVFLLGWGYVQALSLGLVSLAAGLGIAMYPVYKHRADAEGRKVPTPALLLEEARRAAATAAA